MNSKMERCRLGLLAVGMLGALLVASCGGGTQVTKFSPGRVLAFGDETSVIDDSQSTANGRKYTVNGTVSTTDPTLDCRQNPIWIQSLAIAYGKVFPQCNPALPTAVLAPASRIRAKAGAMVADVAAQIDAQMAESAITTTDLATMLIGQNDILAQYAQYPGVPEATLVANLQATGLAIGDQVNRLAKAGAKVIVSTVPDLGITPFAYAERAAHTDTDRAALLRRLTKALNDKMRFQIINDGHLIGLLLTDEYVDGVASLPGAGGFINSTNAVCDLTKSALVPPSALDCTTFTLIPGGTGSTYLWADGTHLSSGGQFSLGQLAISRAANNPF